MAAADDVVEVEVEVAQLLFSEAEAVFGYSFGEVLRFSCEEVGENESCDEYGDGRHCGS